jgi:hypothetical protein
MHLEPDCLNNQLPVLTTFWQPSATLRVSCSQCTWSYLVVQTSSTWPSYAPAATSRPSPVLLPMHLELPGCTIFTHTWPSHAPAATSHPPSVLLPMHLELPGCTKFIYLAIPRPCSHQLPSACTAHYAPGATWLYKLHLPGHPTSQQPLAGCLN